MAPHSGQRELIIERGADGLSPLWHMGYEFDGAFQPFAGGISEDVLRALIRVEMERYPGLVTIRDRR